MPTPPTLDPADAILTFLEESVGPLAAAVRRHAADLTEPPWLGDPAVIAAWAEAEVADALLLRTHGVNPELRGGAVRFLDLVPVDVRDRARLLRGGLDA